MKLHSLDIPDRPAELAAWLERHLTGLSLGELAAELLAVGASAEAGPADIAGWLGKSREQVLSEGLAGLPPRRLRTLLEHPRLLVELQTLVLSEGGDHWQRLLADSPEIEAAFHRGGERLPLVYRAGKSLSEELSDRNGPKATVEPAPRVRWYQQPLVASLATAACLLVAFLIYEQRERPVEPGPAPAVASSGWGWSAEGTLGDELSPSEYFERIANGADAWFKKRPTERRDVAQRIAELRQGCSKLILADHKPLGPRDREWLRERCYRWAARFDAQLAAVERGDDPLKVRAEIDETVRRIGETLRARAARTVAT